MPASDPHRSGSQFRKCTIERALSAHVYRQSTHVRLQTVDQRQHREISRNDAFYVGQTRKRQSTRLGYTFTCDRLCLPHLDTRNQRLFSVLPNVRASLNTCRPCIRDTSSCRSRPRRSSIRHCTGTKRTSPTGIRVHPTTLGFGRSKTQASIRHAHPARRIPGRISGLGSLVPRRRTVRYPKSQSLYQGPFTILRRLNAVNYSVQRNPRSRPWTVHVDKLKPYHEAATDLTKPPPTEMPQSPVQSRPRRNIRRPPRYR